MKSELFMRVDTAFLGAFGAGPELRARAPGRVNLIGEHTDYNDGFVLPAAIGVETVVAASPRGDRMIEVVAADFDGAVSRFSLDTPIPRDPANPWADYVRGMIAVMAAEGIAVTGANLAVGGSVPQGAGLSSSASLEMATGVAMAALAGVEIDPTRLALLAQRAESEFVGCKCGIMDQLVSARGVAGHAVLIDCRSLKTRAVPIPETLAIMIVHSGVSRGLVEGAYNQRRAQCEAVAAHFGVAALRDLDLGALEAGKAGLDEVHYRRARHVVTENQRTLDAAEALASCDIGALRDLMAVSHASMRDDFEITVPAVDRLVELLQSAIGDDGGSRMTGGGFGGAVVALVKRERVESARESLLSSYVTPSGAEPLIMIETACAGAGLGSV